MSGSLYERQREHKTTQTLMLKGGTTLIAALVAGAAVWQQNSLAACFVLAATLCCAVADVLLEQIFNFGACVFALGHICYLAAYFSEAHFSIATAVSLVVLLAGMYLIHRKQTVGKSDREILSVVAYGLVLSAMTAGADYLLPTGAKFWQHAHGFWRGWIFHFRQYSDLAAAKRLRKPPAGRGAAAVLLRRCLFDCGRAGSWIKITFTLRVFFCMIGYSVKAEIPLCRRHLWWKGRWQKTEAADRIENGV